MSAEEAELYATVDRILTSPSRKKLVVAGPGTGKTTLFQKMLKRFQGEPSKRIVLTFINNLAKDLERDLEGLAEVFTLHKYCLRLLYRNAKLRAPLSSDFRCCPGLASLIAKDWEIIEKSKAPKFIGDMRKLAEANHIPFYLGRGAYYDAVDFDDSVYRVCKGLMAGSVRLDSYDLVLVDEHQDFNRLEAFFIDALGQNSPIMIAGDDDQALYSQLRDASWDYIRSLSQNGAYEVFELPFCMRCPKVVVDAVNDVLTKAHEIHKLKGRIEKAFRYFSPAKGADSEKYPNIALVETSVQREKLNYMGQYIVQAIAEIPRTEREEAAHKNYPAALVIVAKPYRDQIIGYLESEGYAVDTGHKTENKLDRAFGLSILKNDRDSNLGWRVILSADAPSFLTDVITKTADGENRLVDILPSEFRERVLADIDAYEPPEDVPVCEQGAAKSVDALPVKVTTFEGAKGLSAQHVFIAGLHNKELPHNPSVIQDIEICKFIVGLTRTRKKCHLIYTSNFAGTPMSRSSFISWINRSRLDYIKVNKEYWKK